MQGDISQAQFRLPIRGLPEKCTKCNNKYNNIVFGVIGGYTMFFIINRNFIIRFQCFEDLLINKSFDFKEIHIDGLRANIQRNDLDINEYPNLKNLIQGNY